MNINEVTKNANKLHDESIVINALDSSRIREADDEYIGKLRKSGVTAISLCVAAGSADEYAHDFKTTLWYISSWWRVLSQYPDDIMFAEVPEDTEKAKQADKIAVYFGVQNITPLDGNLKLLPVLKKVGVTMMQLTYQMRNKAGNGCGERADEGLSSWGLELVDRLNDIGMIVDLGHSGKQTTLDAIERSKDPVVISHACLKGLADNVRNHTDEEVKALADKGGVIGLAGKSKYLRDNWLKERVTVEDYVDHIEYVRDLVGIDHVGIGTDIGDERKYHLERIKDLYSRTAGIYPEGTKFDENFVAKLHPKGLSSPGDLRNITIAMAKRGFKDEEIKKVIGGNFQRIFNEVIS